MIISTAKKTAMMAVVIRRLLAGVTKKIVATKRLPMVKQVYAKSKKPEPRLCMPGGEMKIETSSRTHQRKEMMRNRMVR